MAKEEYPTKKDIEKHEAQFIGVLRQYFRGLSNLDFVKNDLRVLYGDILLETNNDNALKLKSIDINFNIFLKKMVELKW